MSTRSTATNRSRPSSKCSAWQAVMAWFVLAPALAAGQYTPQPQQVPQWQSASPPTRGPQGEQFPRYAPYGQLTPLPQVPQPHRQVAFQPENDLEMRLQDLERRL